MTDKRGELWLAFDNTTSVAYARKRFLEKYGVEAEKVRGGLGLILAGPVPESGDVASRPSG